MLTEGLVDVLAGVQFVNHSVEDFLAAILACQQRYIDNIALIAEGAVVANYKFGEQALLDKIIFMTNLQRHPT